MSSKCPILSVENVLDASHHPKNLLTKSDNTSDQYIPNHQEKTLSASYANIISTKPNIHPSDLYYHYT